MLIGTTLQAVVEYLWSGGTKGYRAPLDHLPHTVEQLDTTTVTTGTE